MAAVKTVQVDERVDGSRDSRVLRSPQFWAWAWAEDRNTSPYVRRKIRSEGESMEFWSGLAPTYGEQASGKAMERVAKVMDILDREKMLEPGAAILDVGCGPGTYSLPFAERVRTVTALDGADGMCDMLRKRAGAKDIANINVMNHLWKDVDLDGHGMARAFDLVFASMTPAVCDDRTLLKLNRASRKSCCLITSDGGHGGKARDELWERIFQEHRNSGNGSLMFIFNFLYSMGCRPSLQYMDTQWVREEQVDKAVERFARSFWLYSEMTPEIRKTITRFVNEQADNGIFREEIKSRLGVIIWDAADA